jgi:hypothetical protein
MEVIVGERGTFSRRKENHLKMMFRWFGRGERT